MTRRSLILLAMLAVLFVAVQAVLASRLGRSDDRVIFDWMWLEGPIYLAAVAVVLLDRGRGDEAGRRATRRATAAILVVGAVLRLMLVPIDPVSTDVNRYVWDGRVQAAGISPYAYVPADPALASLRDEEIYPEINRKDYARTIYPPLAQIVFFLVTRVSGTVVAMKSAMTLFDLATIAMLLRLLALRGQSTARILLYAWHPIPIWHFSDDAHVDAVACTCIAAAMLAAQLKRPVLAGIALGGAALVKFYPLAVGPALWRRWGWRLPLAGALTIAALYLPYLGAGRHLFGFLGGYGDEEGFRDGSGVYLWVAARHVVPGLPQRAFALYPLLALAAMGGLALRTLMRRDRDRPDLGGALALAAAFTVLSSPHYSWYVAWLVPFLPFVASPSVLWLSVAALALNPLGWPSGFRGGTIVFGTFLLLACGELAVRALRRPAPADPVPIAKPLASG